MKYITKINTESGVTFVVKILNDTFSIHYSNDENIYWFSSFNPNKNSYEKIFTITREYELIYDLIDKLYKDIKDCNIFLNDEKNGYIKKIDKYSKTPLFNNGIIDYHSDDGSYEKVSSLKIYKENNDYKVVFTKGYHKFIEYYIKINKSSKRYRYFYLVFLKMYQSLENIFKDNNKGVEKMDDLLEKINGCILTKDILAGKYNIDIPIKEVSEDDNNKIIYKLYSAHKKGLIYRKKEIINGNEVIRYYDITTGIEISLDRNEIYVDISHVYIRIGDTITKESMLNLALNYEKKHISESNVLELAEYQFNGQNQETGYNLIELEEYYKKNSKDSSVNVRKLSKKQPNNDIII
ncbi:MAG: hypothetical protein IJ572_01260 [Bacilli bacterium]|nr:hypothetical protein [Bacilli bacterium]